MRIASFNVNGVNGRIDHLTRWLEATKPDVVCLQELKAPDAKFPAAAVERCGYAALWRGQARWNGVAILARGAEIIETRRALPDDPDPTQARYLEAAVDGVLIACVYAPNGNPRPGPKFDYKLRWLAAFEAHAAALLASDAPVALVGDFNIIPTDLDVYKPESWRDDALMHPLVQASFERLQRQGWTDALRTKHPGARIYTFWDYWRNAWGRDAGLRIDHLLLSGSLAARLKAAGVDREVRGAPHASDHAPVWAEFAGAARKRARKR
ncbi:MAG TPA: exodeoxyribonuclease III [Beijerinckiaceae bacterium]|jgi:exodeoxyribonuclease-3